MGAIVTMAICIAVFIVAIMSTLGAMNASSGIRSAGIFVAAGAGVLVGQFIYRTYIAR